MVFLYPNRAIAKLRLTLPPMVSTRMAGGA
jgi:hypothetical protein